jgi:hypothetical protein
MCLCQGGGSDYYVRIIRFWLTGTQHRDLLAGIYMHDLQEFGWNT